jgi:hypothetical protein
MPIGQPSRLASFYHHLPHVGDHLDRSRSGLLREWLDD